MNETVMIDGRPAQGKPRGIGIYAQRLVTALAAGRRRLGLKVALDKRAGDDPFPELKNVEKCWGTGRDPIRWEQKELPRLAAAAGVSLLHCTANSAPWQCPVPTVVTIHDAIFLRRLREISERTYLRQIIAHYYYRNAIAHGARNARFIITVSQYGRGELIAKLKLPPEKIRVVLSAAPHSQEALNESVVHGVLQELNLTRPYLLAFGAIDLRKNTANIVRAFAQMPRAAVGTLVLAGFERAEQSGVPRLIRRLGLQERVRILGFVPERQLVALYQGAAALLYPSRDEGFGLPILQAFQLGIPVVTSRCGAIPEVAGSAVHFVDPDDPHNIAKELMTILIDPMEAHRMAMSGYLQAKKFSWELCAQETDKLYAEAVFGPQDGLPHEAGAGVVHEEKA